MKRILIVLLIICCKYLHAQTYSEEAKIFSSLKLDGGFPASLLAVRSAVYYDFSIAESELEAIQKVFQQTGIDAVTYFETARSMAGIDCRRVTTKYLIKRNISFLIFLRKVKGQYEFYFTTFNGKIDFVDAGQTTWFIHESVLNNALKTIYQTSIGTEKKQNFLINDLPEHITEKEASAIVGRRNEGLATDLGYFSVAFPKIGNETDDNALERYLKENYTGKYELVDADAEESDLRKKGFLFISRFIHTKGSLAKDILGYESPKSESAIASATFANGQLQLKTIPSENEIYKFYFKKLESGEVFLGKWDADITWKDALTNHLNAYRAENKLK